MSLQGPALFEHDWTGWHVSSAMYIPVGLYNAKLLMLAIL